MDNILINSIQYIKICLQNLMCIYEYTWLVYKQYTVYIYIIVHVYWIYVKENNKTLIHMCLDSKYIYYICDY